MVANVVAHVDDAAVANDAAVVLFCAAAVAFINAD